MPRIGADFYDKDYFVGGSKSAYEDYNLCSGVMRSIADMVLEAYGPLGRVLDVGCAYGFVVEYLRERGVEAWGVDISQYAIFQARPAASAYLCVGNLLALPFADNTFDLVFSSESLEHVYEDQAGLALSEILRVSRGKACLLIGLNEEMEDNDKGHVNLKDRRWWEELAATFPSVHSDEEASHFFNSHEHSQYMKWARRFFCLNVDKTPSSKPVHAEASLAEAGLKGMPAEFFDSEYFDGQGTKSAYKGYTEQGLAGIFPPLAQLLQAPFAPKTALDCGCAKGYLVKAL
ncbi:MAG: class I SAM-dependent methyltransferase, partial [Chloroflexota bacterium]